ncbi:hypothetical protein BJY00DRAFT_325810 [Aspergillus carlsbadensis]|nr:hypothetical protein BJY00DRAFT_325810 [Aspergillus carlsbadensis]
MNTQRQFPSVHWIWGGGISFVYEVHPLIVVKVPKSGEFEKQQFRKECFSFSESGIFLEYMKDKSLSSRIQQNHVRDQQTMVVTMVEKLEPLPLRKEWMNNLAQAVAFLESLGLAHGDLRPENILLDRNQLKLSDFDCTAEIGAKYEACMAPYGRILNSNDSDMGQGESGTFGFLGPRAEQFALGSLYYLINYGFELYGDRCLTDDPYDHGPKVVDLLQNMEFPKLGGNPLIDNIIDKCWHNQYVTVAGLAAHTKELLDGSTSTAGDSGVSSREEEVRGPNKVISTIVRWRMAIGRIFQGLWCGFGAWWTFVLRSTSGVVNPGQAIGDIGDKVDRSLSEGGFTSKKAFCQDLEKRGLLRVLCSGEPEEIGFTFDWYRHSL